MNAFAVTLGLIALLPAMLDAETQPSAPLGPTINSAIQNAFTYAPAPAAGAAKKLETVGGTIRMPRFFVPAIPLPPDQARAIDAFNLRIRGERFSPVTGGAFYRTDIGRARIEAGGWPAGTALVFLRISW